MQSAEKGVYRHYYGTQKIASMPKNTAAYSVSFSPTGSECHFPPLHSRSKNGAQIVLRLAVVVRASRGRTQPRFSRQVPEDRQQDL